VGSELYRRLVEILKRHNCTFVRQAKGSHEIWRSPTTQRTFVVVKNSEKLHTLNGALKDAGIEERL